MTLIDDLNGACIPTLGRNGLSTDWAERYFRRTQRHAVVDDADDADDAESAMSAAP